MHAYLVLGNHEKLIKQEIDRLSKSLAKEKLEFTLNKIEDVRELNKFIKLSLKVKTAIIIENIDKATTPAVNAFLKTLEEPQENINFILTASSEYKVIPTIVSRCQILRVGNGKQRIIDTEISKFTEKTLGGKMQSIDNIKTREKAVEFLESLIFSQHELLVKGSKNTAEAAKVIEAAQEALTGINKNGNVGLQLTNFVVNLP